MSLLVEFVGCRMKVLELNLNISVILRGEEGRVRNRGLAMVVEAVVDVELDLLAA